MPAEISAVPRHDVLGCPVDALSLNQTVAKCLELIEAGGGRQFSVNAGKVVHVDRDPEFAQVLSRAEIVSADGVPIVWAAWMLGSPIPGRVNGTDLMEALLEQASAKGLRIFILGATTAVLHRAVARIERTYPGALVVGVHHGYFSLEEEPELVSAINESKPDLLFMAMGSPAKELWLDRNWEHLRVGFAMGVGGSIDVLAGLYPRAPRWMQRAGLEWFHRLLLEPRRMWRRYLFGNVRFLQIVFRNRSRRFGRGTEWASAAEVER